MFQNTIVVYSVRKEITIVRRIGEACTVVAAATALSLGVSAETGEASLSLAQQRMISAGRYSGGCVLEKVVTKGWQGPGNARREVELTVDLTASKQALELDKKSDTVTLVGQVTGRAGMLHNGHVYGIQQALPPADILTDKGQETFSVFPHSHHEPGEEAAVYVEAVASSNQGEGTRMNYTDARVYCGTMVVGKNSVWELKSSKPPLPTEFWQQ